ncbi:MAG: RsmE family RNA methyltransferase [Thermodesulfobacteriota bacterium]
MDVYGRVRLDKPGEPGKRYMLNGEAFRQLKLWAPRPAEALTVVDRDGRSFRARVMSLDEDKGEVILFEEGAPDVDTAPEITLLQALPGRERMELIIQKTVELGISRIIPFKSAKSISLEQREARQKKAHKWGDIALKASKQSRRDFLARVFAYRTFEEALEEAEGADLKIALWEKENSRCIKEALKGADVFSVKKIALLSGPEGGFSEGEIKRARQSGFLPVTLGPAILRAETAAITAVALVLYELQG